MRPVMWPVSLTTPCTFLMCVSSSGYLPVTGHNDTFYLTCQPQPYVNSIRIFIMSLSSNVWTKKWDGQWKQSKSLVLCKRFPDKHHKMELYWKIGSSSDNKFVVAVSTKHLCRHRLFDLFWALENVTPHWLRLAPCW